MLGKELIQKVEAKFSRQEKADAHKEWQELRKLIHPELEYNLSNDLRFTGHEMIGEVYRVYTKEKLNGAFCEN